MLRNTGNFFEITGKVGFDASNPTVIPESCGQFPYNPEQGINYEEQGNSSQEQGMIWHTQPAF